MQSMKDIAGQPFGRLTALRRHGVDKGGNVMWECVCECGNTTIVRGGHLRSGQIQACGGKGRSCRRPQAEGIRLDKAGKTFGKLEVLRQNGYVAYTYPYGTKKIPCWECQCACGTLVTVLGSRLREKANPSCGCVRRQHMLTVHTKHGLYHTPEYRLWWGARRRAREYGIPFNLDIKDIHIPEYCPLLGIQLAPGKKNMVQSSPTVDRIDPAKGYVKGNVWVISSYANRTKADHTLETLQHFVRVLEQKMRESQRCPDTEK